MELKTIEDSIRKALELVDSTEEKDRKKVKEELEEALFDCTHRCLKPVWKKDFSSMDSHHAYWNVDNSEEYDESIGFADNDNFDGGMYGLLIPHNIVRFTGFVDKRGRDLFEGDNITYWDGVHECSEFSKIQANFDWKGKCIRSYYFEAYGRKFTLDEVAERGVADVRRDGNFDWVENLRLRY